MTRLCYLSVVDILQVKKLKQNYFKHFGKVLHLVSVFHTTVTYIDIYKVVDKIFYHTVFQVFSDLVYYNGAAA